MEEIQKIVLNIIPAAFYFAPTFFFPGLYKKYIEAAWLEFRKPGRAAFDEIERLRGRVSRIIDFITFFTIAIVTPVAVCVDRTHHCFLRDPLALFLTMVFAGLAIGCLVINFRKRFEINVPLKLLESTTVIFSSYLIIKYG